MPRLVALLCLALALGCGCANVEVGGGGDADGDSDTDADTDGDTDADTDPTVCDDEADCPDGEPCVDGYCCDGPCDGTCEACNLPGSLGQCAPYEAGTDPQGECAPEDPATCGLNGSCDGAAACAFYGDETDCDDGLNCTDDDACDGKGVCAGVPTSDCDPALGNECCVGTCSETDGCATEADVCADLCEPDELTTGLACDGCGAANAAGECIGGASTRCTSTEHVLCAAAMCADTTYYCTNEGGTWAWRTAPACSDLEDCTYNDVCVEGTCGGVTYDCPSDECMTRECDGEGGCDETPHPDATCGETVCPSDACTVGGDWEDYAATCANQCDAYGECEICSCEPAESACAVGDGNECCAEACADATGCSTVAGSCGGVDTCTANTLDVASFCNGCGENGAVGTCSGGGVFDCTDAGDACQAVACDGVTYYCTNAGGGWQWREAPACDDGNACTYNDTCGGGVCDGTDLDCDALDTTCMNYSCDGDDTCAAAPQNVGGACADSDPCTYGMTCSSDGACTGGATVTCTDTACYNYECDGDDTCAYTINVGASCDDGNPLTTSDTCQADGSCVGSTCTTASINFTTNWNTTDYGFTAAAPWTRGAPSATTCHSGANCFATSLNSAYGNCRDASLTSPSINLSSCGSTTVELHFWHIYNCESASYLWDGGNLQFSANGGSTWTVIEPAATPYTGTIYSTSTSCSPLPSIMTYAQEVWGHSIASWQEVVVTVPGAYKTNQFRFRFQFATDSSVDSYMGWVVDDPQIIAY